MKSETFLLHRCSQRKKHRPIRISQLSLFSDTSVPDCFHFFLFSVIVRYGIRSKCCSGKQVTIVSEHTYCMKNSNNKIKFIEAQHEDFCNRSVVQFAYCFSCIIKCFSGDMNLLIGYEYHDVRTIYRKLNKVAFFRLVFFSSLIFPSSIKRSIE